MATAKKNAIINEVTITFLEKNILETADLEQQFDIIVSNPPYVRNQEKKEIKKNDLAHEPHLALFVEDDDESFAVVHDDGAVVVVVDDEDDVVVEDAYFVVAYWDLFD